MKAVNDVLARSAKYLEGKGIESPRRLAEQMLCGLLNLSRMDLYLDFDRPLNDDELEQCRGRLKRLGEGEPIQYIEGVVNFLDCTIEVEPSVLIPRPETEELADKIIRELKTRDLKGKKLWDLCTGSGCLGIAIKKACPELEVVLSDISENACAIARKNAALNHVEADCRFGDLLTPFEGQTAHFIVSNPPYVSEAEYSSLDVNVREFEPEGALVAGAGGLNIYKRLARDLKKYLAPGGKAWMEIGFSQGGEVTELFERSGFTSLKVECDLSGRHRFFSLENE